MGERGGGDGLPEMGAPLPFALIGSPWSKLWRRSRTGRRCFGALEGACLGLMSVAVAVLTIKILEMLASSNKMIVFMLSISKLLQERNCCRARLACKDKLRDEVFESGCRIQYV